MSRASDIGKAMHHPLRCRILKALAGGRVASPSELAPELGEELSNVSYHMRQLASFKCVKKVKQRPVRGSVEHFYKETVAEPWAREALGLSDG